MNRKAEWTLIFAVIAGALNWLVGFQLDFLTAEQAALWIVVINAVAGAVAAWRTRPIPPQVYTYLISSLAALATAYGLNMSQEHVASFSTLAIAFLGLVTRGQVSPVETRPVSARDRVLD